MPRATSGPMLLSHPGSVFMTLDTIDGHTDDRCLGHHLGPGWCLKATHPRGHTDLNGLCRHLGPWWHLSSGFYQGPIWVQSTTTAWDLCWCLWPKLPPIATRMPEVLATTCGCLCPRALLLPRLCWSEWSVLSHGAMVSFRPGMLPQAVSPSVTLLPSELISLPPATTKGCIDVWDLVNHMRTCWFPKANLGCHPGLWWHLLPWAMLGTGPAAARVWGWADIIASYYHQGLCWCP